MSRPLRTVSSGTFFITAITAQRRPIFRHPSTARLFIDTLQHYRREGLYKLHAFVVMPDHIHLLITTEALPNAMKHIRGGFSHRLASKLEVWQRGYTDHFVQSREDFESRREYLLNNPVRARLCQRPEDFLYSSAYRQAKARD